MIVNVIVHNDTSKMLHELGNINFDYSNLGRKEVVLINIDAFTSHLNYDKEYTEVYCGNSVFIVDMTYDEFSYLFFSTDI